MNRSCDFDGSILIVVRVNIVVAAVLVAVFSVERFDEYLSGMLMSATSTRLSGGAPIAPGKKTFKMT